MSYFYTYFPLFLRNEMPFFLFHFNLQSGMHMSSSPDGDTELGENTTQNHVPSVKTAKKVDNRENDTAPLEDSNQEPISRSLSACEETTVETSLVQSVPSTSSSSVSSPSQYSETSTEDDQYATQSTSTYASEEPKTFNMNTFEGRCASIEHQLTNESVRVINKNELHEFVFHHGVPEKRHLRSLVWKLLLGYLSFHKDDWANDLRSARKNYEMYLRELTANPYEKVILRNSASKSEDLSANPLEMSTLLENEDDPLGIRKRETVAPEEDPLACGNVKNEWTEFFKDEEIREEIEKDVKRTYSTLHFFQLPVHPDDHKDVMMRKQIQEEQMARDEGREPLVLFTDFAGSSNMTKTAGLGSARRAAARTKARRTGRSTTGNTVNQLQEITIGADKGPDCHHDVLRRLLFLYAKLNPGVRYVQGMNEILAPIYYVFASEPDYVSCGKGTPYNDKTKVRGPFGDISHSASRSQSSSDEEAETEGEITKHHSSISGLASEDLLDVYLYSDAEADAFFCFTNVMAEIRDRFIKSLDESETGVLASIQKLNDLLRRCDEELWAHMNNVGVDPRFYSFRWLTLLSSQEFELPEVLRLWDSFFADRKRFDLHHYFCVGMLVNIRQDIISGDFANILRMLQQYPDCDTQHLLLVAHDLRVSVEMRRRSRYVPKSEIQKETPLSPSVMLTNLFNRAFGKK